MNSAWPLRFAVEMLSDTGETDIGRRLDAAISARLTTISRVRVQRAIEAGLVTVSGRFEKSSYKLELGDEVTVERVDVLRESPAAEDIPLEILYEDAWLAVINKPAGMVVHPAKGHWQGTLAGAITHHFQSVSSIGGPTRPGIVHRLDRDTSGVIIVARTDDAHQRLADQFKHRTVTKEYMAIVRGVPDRDGDVIDRPIGDHPRIREMKVIREGHESSRNAITTFEVVERWKRFAMLRVLPKTGRTHQIRVHLASVRLPIVCDKLYGGADTIREGELLGRPPDMAEPPLLSRQALHAHRLAFAHPEDGRPMDIIAPLAADLESLIARLREV